MEIGSFIELQFPAGLEFYSGSAYRGMGIARLNSGKAALFHAFRITGCQAVWLPVYLCDCVREFFKRKQVAVHFYHIDRNFEPLDLSQAEHDAVLLVNYYGIMSESRMRQLSAQYNHVIIDNCQAFFATPLPNCQNVYSCRKFIGVPDGAYVIGNNADDFCGEYPQGFSSDTALFLLQRIEYGCEGKAYQSRTVNENRVENEDVMKMSKLTRSILDGTDYQRIQTKRRENFHYADSLLRGLNCLSPTQFLDAACVPMVYPFLAEDNDLLDILQAHKHFQGHWWSYLLPETSPDSAEHWLSKYIIPITIDQRYGKNELDCLFQIVESTLNNKGPAKDQA